MGVQKHTIVHEANNVILDCSDIAGSARVLGDHHGVVLIGWIVHSSDFDGLV